MNPFRHLLKSAGSHPPIGTWIMSASPLVAEALGHAGFDWGVIDMEHSPLDIGGVLHLLQAVGNTKMVPVVRVPGNDPVTVKRVLDAGAQTVMFPLIEDADEAVRAVASTRYPPMGMRGFSGMNRSSRFGTQSDPVKVANRQMGVILQIESPQALDRIDEIAAVPGVDALFVGPSDLAACMGHPDQWMHPEVMDRMTRAARQCAALGMPFGTLGESVSAAAQYRAAGFSFIAVGADLRMLMQGAQSALGAMRGQSSDRNQDVHVHTLAEGTVVDNKGH